MIDILILFADDILCQLNRSKQIPTLGSTDPQDHPPPNKKGTTRGRGCNNQSLLKMSRCPYEDDEECCLF